MLTMLLIANLPLFNETQDDVHDDDFESCLYINIV